MPRYSHSRIETYYNCPLCFKFRYIDKLKTEVTGSVEAFLGSRIHSALEKLYRDRRFMKKNTLEALISYYNSDWEKNWNAGIEIVRKEYTPENYRAMGVKFLGDYYRRHEPFDEGMVIGLEKKVNLPLDKDKKYSLIGFIDRLMIRKDGTYEIHDYKTSSSLALQEYLDSDRQLALYEIAVRRMFPDVKRVELVWHYLAFDREMRSSRTPEQLEALKKETIARIDEIERCIIANEFPAKESPLCGWCQYQDHCPKRKHGRKVSGMQANEYLKEPGVKLVNKLVELEAKKQEFLQGVEPEIGKVKEALFAYTEKEGVDNVSGSDHLVKIFSYMKTSWPQKGSESREALIATLNEHRRFLHFADVDVYSLTRALNRHELSLELERKLERFANKTPAKILRIAKKDCGG